MNCRFVNGLALAMAFLAAACSKSPMEQLVPNQPPTVALSAEPLRHERNYGIATFHWHAFDADGQVTRFRYALDDTAATWFETDAYDVTLSFTTNGDSTHLDTVYVFREPCLPFVVVYSETHTFFVKAVDDDGAESLPASISFTARTLAPQTVIVEPDPRGLADLGPSFPITWQGLDPDDPAGPVGYSWRLVRHGVICLPEAAEAILLDPDADGDPWSPYSSATTVQLDSLEYPAEYLFGVRSVDQAGVVEPRLRLASQSNSPNILRIGVHEQGGVPILTVYSAIRTATFPTADAGENIHQLLAGQDARFVWEGDASAHGGSVAGYSYGVDLQSLEEDDPGWAPESLDLTEVTLRFDVPPGVTMAEHTLHIRVRDNVGSTSIADLGLIVLPTRGERDVLLVDDWGLDSRGRPHPDIGPICQPISAGGQIPDESVIGMAPYPQDYCHDAHLHQSIGRALERLGHSTWAVDRYEPLDPIRGRALSGQVEIDSTTSDHWVLTGPVTVEQLLRYKLVIWNSRSSPYSFLRTMNREFEDNALAAYLEAGGVVWVSGTGVFVRTVSDSDRVPGLGQFGYQPEDFTYRFLKVESRFEGSGCQAGCFRQGGSTCRHQREHGFEGAYTSAMAQSEQFPELRVTREPFGNNSVKGIPDCGGMVVGYGLDINPRLELFGGRLDTLYFYMSNWRLEVHPPGWSWLDDSAVGLRYGGPGQGRLMMFGFPLFFFPDDQLDDLLTAGMRWLLVE